MSVKSSSPGRPWSTLSLSVIVVIVIVSAEARASDDDAPFQDAPP